MSKVPPITERPIHVYTCLSDPTRKCVALIDGWPMVFRGETPMQAKRAADEWRREAVANDKMLTKARKAELLGEAS
jgi:hypothetical protein